MTETDRAFDDPRAVAARKLDLARARKLWRASFVVVIFGTLAAAIHPANHAAPGILGNLAVWMCVPIAALGWLGTRTPHRVVRWAACGMAMAIALGTVAAAVVIANAA